MNISSKRKFPLFVWSLFFFIALVHALAVYFSLYWRWWWIDMVMHFLGGVWAASLMCMIIYHSKRVVDLQSSVSFFLLIVLGFTALVGVLWEFFEFSVDQFVAVKINIDLAQLGLEDTMSDLFFDLLGGLAVALALIRKRKYEQS